MNTSFPQEEHEVTIQMEPTKKPISVQDLHSDYYLSPVTRKY
jgi:hypothetical protein